MASRARSRWSALAASALIQCFAGRSYCFGVYSPALKASQGYDQSALDAVAFFKDVGANVGVLSGLLAAWAPAGGRRRPWIVLLAGAALCAAGYLPMWLAVAGVAPAPLPLVCLYMLLAAQAQTFLNTADVVTAVENFPDRRGTVIGIMKVQDGCHQNWSCWPRGHGAEPCPQHCRERLPHLCLQQDDIQGR